MTAPASRPLRAAGAVLGGWIALRTALLWSGGAAPIAAEAADVPLASPPAREAALDPSPPPAQQSPPEHRPTVQPPPRSTPVSQPAPVAFKVDGIASIASGTALFPAIAPELPGRPPRAAPAAPPNLPALPLPPSRDRFQLSGWALVRGATSAGGLAPGGTLGGSQAGARVWYEPGPPGLALTARVSSPLATRGGSEASLGIGYRKGAVGVILEERFSLDAGVAARPSVTVFGGVSDVRLPGKLRLDGYAQAGIVGLKNRIGFIDGALRVERTVAGKTARLSIGAGAWGGAQPGLARLDIGPQLVARLPVLTGTVRIAADYRVRVAGRADPGSGPTLSLGMDF
jgi:hypothetical protein